jgi:phosphoribosylformylglycinamidine cyclo-ligase
VVEADALLGPDRVQPGDLLVAMASSGLHSNGYSLVRHVVFERSGWSVDREVPELGRTLGAELLEPTRVYALDCLALLADEGAGVHALSHVTGGGLAANLARVLPDGVKAVVDRGSWTPPPVFGLVARLGNVERAEIERSLNQGVGMVAVVAASGAGRTLAVLRARGVACWVLGEVRASAAGPATVDLAGEHPAA